MFHNHGEEYEDVRATSNCPPGSTACDHFGVKQLGGMRRVTQLEQS